MFQKTCYECGAKVDKVHEGICEKCYRQQVPPIADIKMPQFKIDNVSKKILYKNTYYSIKEIEEMLPNIMKKQVKLNEAYELNDITIEDVDIEGNKLCFDVVVDASFKN